jgi:hypothetical protein
MPQELQNETPASQAQVDQDSPCPGGKEMIIIRLAFTARQEEKCPVKYNRALVAAAIKAMERVEEIKRRLAVSSLENISERKTGRHNRRAPYPQGTSGKGTGFAACCRDHWQSSRAEKEDEITGLWRHRGGNGHPLEWVLFRVYSCGYGMGLHVFMVFLPCAMSFLSYSPFSKESF